MTQASARIPPGPTAPYQSTEDLFAWMNENYARYGDIYKASVYGGDVYVVSDPVYCDRILRWNWQNYPRKGQVVKRISLLLGNGLISSNGDFWANQRRMIQPSFTKGAVGALIDTITQVNLELLENWTGAAERAAEVNVTLEVSQMVLKFTLLAIFGEDYARVAPQCSILAEESARTIEFAQTFRPLSKLIVEIARERRAQGTLGHDILGRMMQARDRERGEPMPDAQLAREAMTLIVAGHETTAGLLNWLWYLLSRHPEVHSELLREFDSMPWSDQPTMESLPRYAYTRQVIDEALRLYPPLWLMTRKAVNDDVLGEFLVPAGTEIYISPYLIQRNPHLWEAPAEFRPQRLLADARGERHELALCPFGAGPRNCIGELFARVEIQVHVMMFARALRLRYDETRPPEITTGLNLLSKHDFMMRPEMIAALAQ
jgi:cytochrome P450